MRKSTLFVLVFSLSLTSLSIVNVLGNAPSALTLAYSTETNTLSVTITHPSPTPNTHYIKTVEITKNSETPEVHTYTSQPSTDTFTYEYSLNATPGDSITVKAICVIFGDRTTSLTVPTGSTSTSTGTSNTSTSSTTPTPTQGIPGYLGWIIMISGGVSLLFLIRFYRSRAMKKD